LAKAIKEAVGKNKLIFAAASNTGQYGSRAWPATATGVFAIHATNDHGTVDTDLNPQPSEILDNFATFGCNVVSFWDGQYRSISGTSFATPIAAAIAANIVEFIRRKLPDIADQFTKYSTMKRLFKERMTPDGPAGSYHILKPWVQELWSEENDIENVCRELHEFDTFG
jgi:subtilisin family serine protease